MSLFDISYVEMPVCIPQYASKNEKFRCQIRRKHYQEKFKSVRRQLIQSLKSLNFLEELKSERDNLTSRKIQWLIKGLSNGKNNASFYQQMLDMRLEPYLCDMANNKQIRLIDKNKIINSLVELTYFTSQFSADFNDSKFIDQMRLQLSKLDLANDIDFDYAYYTSTLIQNLTAFQNKQFNHFMVESDFLPTLKKLINQPTNDPKQLQNAADLRLIWLKIYKNLLHSNQLQFNYICKTFVQIVEDSRNYQSEDKIVQIFKCLREITIKQGFWEYMEVKKIKQLGKIMEEILDLVTLMAQRFSEKCFEGFINFMDQLNQSDQIAADDLRMNLFERIIELHPSFFLDSLKQLNRNSQSGASKRVLCKTLKVLSYFQFSQIYSTKATSMRKTQFVQYILAKYIFTHCTYGKYAVRLLSQMLAYDKTIIDVLIDFGIVDGIRDFLDCKFFTKEKVDIIKLAEQLIDVEQDLKQERAQNKVINCFQGRGIVRDIQQLQNDPNRQVYKRAEQFMSRLSAITQAHQNRR